MQTKNCRTFATMFLFSLINGCMTPMGPADIDQLTTCRGRNLQKIRQNLLLNGYEIKSESPTDLVTDFKQIGGFNRRREFQRITVIMIDEKTARFKVRLRSIDVIEKSSSGVSMKRRGHDSGGVDIEFRQDQEVTNDDDHSYYQERRSEEEALKREVCGDAT